MATVYCPVCRVKDQPYEMETVYNSSRYGIYRCAICLRMRKVTYGPPQIIEDVSLEEARKWMR